VIAKAFGPARRTIIRAAAPVALLIATIVSEGFIGGSAF
jgi:hypothetical protein